MQSQVVKRRPAGINTRRPFKNIFRDDEDGKIASTLFVVMAYAQVRGNAWSPFLQKDIQAYVEKCKRGCCNIGYYNDKKIIDVACLIGPRSMKGNRVKLITKEGLRYRFTEEFVEFVYERFPLDSPRA